MNEKFVVQFITLLASAITCILLAIKVWNNQIDVVRALVILLVVIIIFYIIGRIFKTVLSKMHAEAIQRIKEEIEKEKAEQEQQNEKIVVGDKEIESEVEIRE